MLVNKVITIDGLSASGKSSVSSLLAEYLNYKHISSGDIYRIIAYYGIQKIGSSFASRMTRVANYLIENPQSIQISLDGKNKFIFYLVGRQLRKSDLQSESVANVASKVALSPDFRNIVSRYLIRLAHRHDLVVDGRDMGTVVFPKANHKFFLTASPSERAKRRALQSGIELDSAEFKKLLSDINERDKKDTNRKIAPTKQAADAMLIDTSDLSKTQVVEKIKSYVKTA